MSKDHFIARTYLKHFGDPSRSGMLHAYRKSDGKTFPCWPADVCWEWDGDLNPNVFKDRPKILGELRKIFEPHWNEAIDSILEKRISNENKFLISAHIGHLMTCTPTWRRIGVGMGDQMIRQYLSFYKKMKDKHGGEFEIPRDGIEMIERGEMTVHTKPEYIKAISTQHLLEIAWEAYNQDWTVLRNNTDSPFLTSDNPVALSESRSAVVPSTRYLPITPRLCLSVNFSPNRVKPLDREKPSIDLQRPPMGTIRGGDITAMGARIINRAVVQCAEDLVFSSVESEGIRKLVSRYAKYRVESEFVEFPAKEPDAIHTGSILRARERQAA